MPAVAENSYFRVGSLLDDISVREYALYRNADHIRVSALLVEDGRLLVVRQVLKEQSFWNIPGGKLELGETLAQCAVREMLEETGIHVDPIKLLYVSDRTRRLGNKIIDVTYLVRRSGESGGNPSDDSASEENIGNISHIAASDLCSYGLGRNLAELIQKEFPNSGSYVGEFHRFYGCGKIACSSES